MQIEGLELPTKTRNALRRLGYTETAELLKASNEELLKGVGIGIRALGQIRDSLASSPEGLADARLLAEMDQLRAADAKLREEL